MNPDFFAEGLRFCNRHLIKIKYIDVVGKSHSWKVKIQWTPHTPDAPPACCNYRASLEEGKHHREIMHIFLLLC